MRTGEISKLLSKEWSGMPAVSTSLYNCGRSIAKLFQTVRETILLGSGENVRFNRSP
jgi:hypothetical protein